MINAKRVWQIANLSGFHSRYAFFVLLLLLAYAITEGTFATAVADFNIEDQLGQPYNLDNLTLGTLFIAKLFTQAMATFALVKFGYFSGLMFQSHVLSSVNQQRQLTANDDTKASIKRYLLNEPSNIANLITIPFMLLLSELLVSITLGFIVISNVSTALLVMSFQIVIAIAIFGYMTRKITTTWGEFRKQYEDSRIRSINTYLDNFNFITLNRFQETMHRRIETETRKQFRYNSNQGFLDKCPRMFLEISVVTIILASLMFQKAQGSSTDYLVGELVLLGYTGYRLFPASNRILMSLQSINFALQGVEDVLEFRAQENGLVSSVQHGIKIQNSKLTIPSGTIKASNKNLLSWPEYEIDGTETKIINIAGRNGAGKSIFMQGISGCFNQKIQPETLAFIPQDLVNIPYALWDLSEVLQTDSRSSLKHDDEFTTSLSEMSGGQRQKALLKYFNELDNQIIFMDEPSSALDSKSKGQFWELLQKQIIERPDVWMLIITHDPIPTSVKHHTLIVDNGNVNFRQK